MSDLSYEPLDVNPRATLNRSHVLLYDTDTAARILTMASLPDGERSLPFLQRVHLMGPGDYSVRATGQVDDGAMKNCISKERWDRYGHCLSALHPSTTHIKVANGSKLKPLGRWFGTIRVGGVSAASWFEVFDSHGAFDVILGKPWLEQVKATHDYGTDQLSITNNGNTDILSNKANTVQIKESTTTPTDKEVTLVTVTHETPPDDQLDREWLRAHQIQASESPWKETKWAKYLDIEPLNIDTSEDNEMDSWTTDFLANLFNDDPPSLMERDRLSQKLKSIELQRNSEGEVLLAESIQECNEERERIRLSTPKPKPKRQRRLSPQAQRNLHHIHLLEESERRINILRSKLDHLRSMIPQTEDNNTTSHTDDVYVLGEVDSKTFKLDRGTNKSLRTTEPFNETRINEILSKIEFGPNLTEDQLERVKALVREFADVFALSMSEVIFVDWHHHHLNVDPNVTLPKRMSQRPITENQKEWYYDIIDEMESAHVIQKVPGDFIKCLNSTNLAPKEAGKMGATRVEILRKVNAECIKNGLPPFWEEVMYPGETNEALLDAVEGEGPTATKSKWRVCHAYMALNRATKIPAFPQGDLNQKHQFAASHEWLSVIDFANGYYAVPLDDESVPYTAFYVEGRGYYVYLRMPFGLTGAPATFQEMIAIALEDMIGRELVNWMDDICIPGDDFDIKLKNLRKFFTRCRDKSLSLSPSKTKLFFTNALFAGAMIGPDGIKPNLDKVAAVVNWPQPQDVQDLMSFLGLTGYFRRLINDYTRIAAPLTDLTRKLDMEIPKKGWKARKGAYKRALQSMSLHDKWTSEHQKAFITLKVLLSQEPLLKSPQYDGRPFRITSDGSLDGFAGWLSQEFETKDKNGKAVKRWFPIAFCSKRTSSSEARYEPFLLEFAALKFCFDEFKPYVFGAPVEIETDCQALRDCLLKDKMNSHHSRWMESILSHNIIDIRHRPGIENPVADGLSRMWRNRKRSTTDGSSWSVLPDWEAMKGITNDVLSVASPNDTSALPLHPLEVQFQGDIFFTPIIRHLLGKSAGDSVSERRRAMHRAEGFTIDDGKLWRVSTKAHDRVPRTECQPTAKGFQLALECHERNGHFQADLLKLKLKDKYFWPRLDTDCRQACLECSKCKNFGPAVLTGLLHPIRRSKPFELTAGDYLSMPKGKGGYKHLGVYIDTCSGFIWVTKLKSYGTGASTVGSLRRICLDYAIPHAFMSDGGKHFNCDVVNNYCAEQDIQHITTAKYAPWVNGLVESTNNLLLSRLKRLCAPNLDADPADVDPKSIPDNWPDHLDEAVRSLNDRIIPTLNASPREILFGMALRPDTNPLPHIPPQPTSTTDINTHFTLADSFHYDVHLKSLNEAQRKKDLYDSKARVPILAVGDLVQVYNSKADQDFQTIHKLLPRWSEPLLITGKFLNSYTLSDLRGTPLTGLYHIRRLRPFIPLRDSTLDLIHPRDVQDLTEDELGLAEAEQRMMEP